MSRRHRILESACAVFFHKKLCVLVLLVVIAPTGARGQTATAQPKPGPEHQKLSALVGNWTTEGEATENPFGPPEKWSATINSEWFQGGFAVVRRVKGKSSVKGEVQTIDVLAYDAGAKAYTWYSIDSTGYTGLGRATISGDVLTTVWDVQVKSRPFKMRGTLKGLGSDRMSFMAEYSEGTSWKPYFHSTDTKIKAK